MRKTPIVTFAAMVFGASTGVAAAQDDAVPAVPVDEFTEQLSEPTPMAGASARQRAGAKPRGRMARPAPGGKRRLQTGFGDLGFTSSNSSTRTTLLDEARAANARVARLYVSWRRIAPSKRPPAFDPSNPNSLGYDWTALDAAVRGASQRNMRVLLLVNEAPSWAEGANRPNNVIPGTWKPKPGEVAAFGRALARRYSSNRGLPRVRDYMLWNEPNLETNLTPVWNGKKPASPNHYKRMLKRFHGAVHKVNGKNRVVAGNTAPYGADRGVMNMRPLLFWRKLVCVKSNGKAQKKCNKPKFDVATHHPINTSGGPRRSAVHRDDVSTPDLRHLVDVLRTAERAGNVKPKGKRQVWASELWWESDPPDPAGVKLRKHARYYTLAMYLLWKQGASMVLPYQVRDDKYDGNPGRTSFETGTYFVDGKAKPAKRAIQFPFVADRKSKKKVLLWGVSPSKGRVKIFRKKPKGWKRVAATRGRPGRVFKEKVRMRGKQKLQARVKGQKSMNLKVGRK
jgi:hypothetical protein